MDPSYYDHHRHGYTQRHTFFSHPPPSPPPQSYRENPNFYTANNNYYHLRQPPSPPPPIPQRRLVSPPPPPPPSFYSPQQQPPPLLNRLSPYKPNQFPPPSWSSSSSGDVPRSLWVGSGNCYQFEYSRLSNDWLEDKNSRFRDEFKSSGLGRTEENHRGIGDFQPDAGRSSRDLGFRGFESNNGYHDDHRRFGSASVGELGRSIASGGVNENQRWFDDRQVRGITTEMVQGVGGARYCQRKADYYTLERDRCVGGGSREGGNQLNQTDRKMVQKKSVLLRIQNPRPKRREVDRMRHPGYSDEKKSSSFRGKDQVGHTDRGVVEKQKGGAPVELDVSFKSNTLVAKAIMTPTKADAGSSTSEIPRSSKIRRLMVTDQDNNVSHSGETAKADGKRQIGGTASGSDKDSKQSKREVTASGVENKCDSNSIPCYSQTGVSDGKIKEEKSLSREDTVSESSVMVTDKYCKNSLNENTEKLDSLNHVPKEASSSGKSFKKSEEEATLSSVDNKHGSNPEHNSVGAGASDGTIKVDNSSKGTVSDAKGTSFDTGKFPLPKAGKKKKVIKKVVKKVAKSSSKLPVSESTKTLSKPVKEGALCSVTSLKSRVENVVTSLEKRASSAAMLSVGSRTCANLVSENDKDLSPKDFLENKVGVGSESGKIYDDQIKRKRQGSSSPIGSSDQGEVETEKTFMNMEDLTNNKENCDQSLTESTISNIIEIEDGNEKIHEKGDSLFLEKCVSEDGMKYVLTPGEKDEPGILTSEEQNISEDLGYAEHLNSEMNSSARFDELDGNIISGTGRLDPGGNQGDENEVSQLEENGSRYGSSEPSSVRVSGVTLPSKCSAETRDNPDVPDTHCCNDGIETLFDPGNGFTNAEDINCKLGGVAGGQACRNEITSSPEKLGGIGSFNVIPIQGSEEDLLNICKKKEAISREVDWPRPMSADTCRDSVNVDSSALGMVTTLKISCPAESKVDGSKLNAGVNHRTDGVGDLHSGVLTGCFRESLVSGSNNSNFGPHKPLLESGAKENVSSLCDKSSPTASVIDNRFVTQNIGNSGVEMVCNFVNCPQQEKIRSSYTGIGSPSGLPPFSESVKVLLENCSGCESSGATGSAGDSYMDDGLINDPSGLGYEQIGNMEAVQDCSNFGHELTNMGSGRGENMDVNPVEEKLTLSSEAAQCRIPGIDSGSITPELSLPSDSSLNSLRLGSGQTGSGTKVEASGSCHDLILDTDTKGEKMILDVSRDQIRSLHEAVQFSNSMGHNTPCSGQMSPDIDVESDDPLASNFPYLPSASYQSTPAASKSSDSASEHPPDIPSYTSSPGSCPSTNGTHTLNKEPPCLPASDKTFRVLNDKTLDDNYGDVGGSDAALSTSNSDGNTKFASHHAKGDSVRLLAHLEKTARLKPMNQETHGRKVHPNYAVRKNYLSSSSFVFAAKKNVALPARITKPHTWRRTDSPSTSPFLGTHFFSSTVPNHGQLPQKVTEVQNTYIRKGNSLVRKPASSAAIVRVSNGLHSSAGWLSCLTVDEAKNSESDRKVNVNDSLNLVKTGALGSSFERSQTHPLPSIGSSSNHVTISSGELTLSSGEEALLNDCLEHTTDSVKPVESDVPKSCKDGVNTSETPLNQAGYSSESQNDGSAMNLTPSNTTKIIYVKRKSNQLVANMYKVSETRISSDGSYERRRNQLIRTPVDDFKPAVSSPDDAFNAQVQAATKIISKRNSSMVFSDQAVTKPFKHSKFSLVWTLNGTQVRKADKITVQRQEILPQLFPWKRATYWRSLMNLNSVSHYHSFSTVGRKLLLLRKRQTVYTRSVNGYSLRKSKVLSIGGSHLKWSKSIERDSKKANEEATLAVAAVAKKKRENNSGCGVSGIKKRNRFARKSVHCTELWPGERIFRIGSVRYKMDSSRRTLQRISDDESSCSEGPVSGNNAKKSFVPRRLVIGNDEYVRVGNGNQLIRDPKKRTRALASEKVRWSLHTARLRLAKKRKYCQFFTRFGKCNKEDGKCPYIHDASKIAVCTKFLNGLCTNPNCKLTHKVIPERMPDCSYFQQGLCTNEVCPYRHVHVNPNAATCEGFLRGYCADGNECPKKHTYICPIFEATGACPQGSKCKLHHPKKRSKGRKRKRSCEHPHRNIRGRYFGYLRSNMVETESLLLDKHVTNDAVFEGEAADYISLDVSDDEARETYDPASERTSFHESDASDLHSDDLDELIKPIRIMDKYPMS